MLKRYLLATFAGAAVLMVWGFVYWAASPLGFYVLHAAPDEEVVSVLSDTLREQGPGVYLYPFMTAEEYDAGGAEVETFYEKHRRGPLVQIFYRPEGAEPMSPMLLLAGFVHFLTSTAIVAALLMMARASLPTYGRRVLFVFLIGLFGGVAIELGKAIWYYWSWDYQLFQAFFPITGWLLAGLVMAKIIKPDTVMVTAVGEKPA